MKRSLLFLSLLLLATSAHAQLADSVVTIDVPGGKLEGSLLVPASEKPVPVVLLIAGSGPTDRNGNSALLRGANNSLKYLAEALAERGIATLRYDKRGIARSMSAMSSEAALRFETYADDAAEWVRFLRKSPSRFSKVIIAGHSEGSLTGMLAAKRESVDGYVSIAGAGRRISDVLRDQVRPQLPPDLLEQNERILKSLESGAPADSIPPALIMLYRPSVQPYLISWIRYNPAEELASVQAPALVIQGTTDIQVRMPEAERLKQGRPDARLVIIEGMNHIFKKAPMDMTKQQASYSDPSLPVAPELVEAIASFVGDLGSAGR